jgi:hypothetical protein
MAARIFNLNEDGACAYMAGIEIFHELLNRPGQWSVKASMDRLCGNSGRAAGRVHPKDQVLLVRLDGTYYIESVENAAIAASADPDFVVAIPLSTLRRSRADRQLMLGVLLAATLPQRAGRLTPSPYFLDAGTVVPMVCSQGRGSGTAFYIGDGRFLTAKHVALDDKRTQPAARCTIAGKP